VLEHALRPLFSYLHAVVVPTAVYAASEDWGAQGLPERIERAAGELTALMTGLSTPSSASRPAKADKDADKDRDELTVVPFAEQLAALAPR
jgi:FMN reductase